MTDLTPEQRRGLAAAMRAARVLLGKTADDLLADRVTPGQWAELDTALDYLRDLVHHVAQNKT